MILVHSGGSPIPECNLPHPAIMTSFYINVNQKTGQLDSRLTELIRIRTKANKKKKKGKKCLKSKKKKGL